MSAVADCTVVVVGAGGNIGSHLVAHLARMRGVGRVVLVDRDVYEEKNLSSQDIARRDVGKAKVAVQARRLRRINPALAVRAIAEPVENVPLGLLRADVILGCLDSRAARRALNLVAWRLGVPWIDAGVHGEERLARVNVHLPEPGQPCLECAWEARDYEALEQAYPCAGDDAPPATNASSGLGALAASLQALECQKLIDDDREHLAIGRQVTLSALAHRHYVTRFAPNPACRFDHEVWAIETVPSRAAHLTVGQAFALGHDKCGDSQPLTLRVPQQAFARTLSCVRCGARRDRALYLLGRIEPAEQVCPGCGGKMRAAGFDVVEGLSESDVSPAMRFTALRSLGFRRGDVLTMSGATGAVHFQIGGVA